MILYDVRNNNQYIREFRNTPFVQDPKVLVRVMSEAVTSYLVGFQRVRTLLKLKSYWIQDRTENTREYHRQNS